MKVGLQEEESNICVIHKEEWSYLKAVIRVSCVIFSLYTNVPMLVLRIGTSQYLRQNNMQTLITKDGLILELFMPKCRN